MLCNDFTQPRWKGAADKNAMVLVGRKNYTLAMAFFLLAGKVKDAVSVAIDRMKDLSLAILICRIIEGEDSQLLKDLYQKYCVDIGTKNEDVWLVNIGLWWRKEYIDAVNALAKGSLMEEPDTQTLFDRTDEAKLYPFELKHTELNDEGAYLPFK